MHEIYIFTLEKICSVRQRPIPKAPSCIATFVCLGLSTFVHTANYSFIFPTHHIPYKGGLFYLKIIFPDDYPTGKPEILFLSPIYHLNVKFFTGKDKPLGHICVNTLNDWNPGDSVKKILPKLLALLYKIIQIVLMILMIIQEEMNLLIIEHYLTKKLNISQKNIQRLLLKLKNFQMYICFLQFLVLLEL